MKGYVKHLIESDAGPLSAYLQTGHGAPVVFQHGLCGDAQQPAEAFPANSVYRHAVLDCRGHGSSPVGSADGLSIACFANDVAAMIRALGVKPAAVGGISMGAAIALRLAVRQPSFVPALILARPAWVVEAAPDNMQPNAEVGKMILAGEGAEHFAATRTALRLSHEAPDNLASLTGFFGRSPLNATGELLARISADGPGVTEADLATLRIPTLVVGTEEDVIHPLSHARRLAALIPGAQLAIVPPKGRDRAAHTAAMQTSILGFLKGLQ